MRVLKDGRYVDDRIEVSPYDLENIVDIRYDVRRTNIADHLYKKLIVPSYAHSYSVAIEYYYNWFREKFPSDYFRGGIYIDSKNVLDEYKQPCKTLVKKESPKARIIPTLDFDYDREDTDIYQAPPEIFLRRSSFEDSFFKDYDRNIYLSMRMKGMRMNFNSKIRVNSRAQQLDLFARMELNFRIGASELKYYTIDFHIPKSIILDLASMVGFDIKDGEIVDIIDFLNYFNQHSDIPLFYKMRAINQQPEFFLRCHDIFIHMLMRDKLNPDSGETDGKLNFNYHVEMENILTTSIPHFYVLHTEQEIRATATYTPMKDDLMSAVAVYSINVYEPPHTDENGWNEAAITTYGLDPGEYEMDLSSIFEGENVFARTIKHDIDLGISPSHFINMKIFTGEDIAKEIDYDIDWKTKIVTIHPNFRQNIEFERVYQIAIYYDRNYIYNLDATINNFDNTRLSKYQHDPSVS